MSGNDGRGEGAGHEKLYQFPYKEPKDGSHYASCSARNCATFIEFLGLAIPEASGLLTQYIPALKLWAEASPLDHRSTKETK